MTLTGTTIYLHNTRRTLAQRLQARKSVGPYQWTVQPAGPSQGRGYYACDDDGTPSDGDCAFRLRSCERPHRINGWYCDDMQDQTMSAVVLRLPRGRGFLAGWTMGKGMASSVDFDVIDCEADAWRIADSMAENAAEAEREYQEKESAKLAAEEAKGKFVIFHPVEIAIEYEAASLADALAQAAAFQRDHTVGDMLDREKGIYMLEPKPDID